MKNFEEEEKFLNKLKLNSAVISLGGGTFINERIRKEILKTYFILQIGGSSIIR